MLKRTFDICASLIGLILLSPILFFFTLAVWIEDRNNPFYFGVRIGKNYKKFKMVKLRSMVINAESIGVDSTSNNDKRITKIGSIVRKFKIDELFQLWCVITGDMSLVGPRPNVERDVNLYTDEEIKILKIVPGITDFSSIVFSDEGEILKDSSDPDLDYNQLIRPWKSRLALIYSENSNLILDFQIIILTILALFNKKLSLQFVYKILKHKTNDQNLLKIINRESRLKPFPPPGSKTIVNKR